jgi:hypothetical protein
MIGFIGECMKRRDDKELKEKKRVRVRIRVVGERRKKISILMVALILLGAAVGGIIIGMFLGNLLSGEEKRGLVTNQVPVSISPSPVPGSAPVSSPFLSPEIED